MIGARLTLEVIAKLKAGPIGGIKQEKAGVTKAPKLTKENGLIDWSRSAQQVANQVRAMQPWPTAYTYLHRAGKPSTRMMIGSTGKIIGAGGESSPPMPGLLWGGEANKLWVFTGDGEAIEISELQPSGKKRMSAAEFLRGHPLKPGDQFSNR
jgi:methionyl-tRNA formyltransferase